MAARGQLQIFCGRKITVDLEVFACLNFGEFLFFDFSRSLEFANLHFSLVALLYIKKICAILEFANLSSS